LGKVAYKLNMDKMKGSDSLSASLLIIKECYWDYNMTPEKISNIVNSDDLRLKKKLFEKILQNSTDKLKALKIFKKTDLQILFDSCNKRNEDVLILENIIFNKKHDIERLKWKKR